MTKKGRARRTMRAASHTLGKLVKTLAVITPPAIVAYQSYDFWDEGGAKKGRGIVHALADFSSCFSGVTVDAGGEVVWMPKRLAVGWGPVLVIGGITYAERKIGMQAANPFRVISAGLG